MCTIIITFIGSVAGAGWVFLSGRPVIRWSALCMALLLAALAVYAFVAARMGNIIS